MKTKEQIEDKELLLQDLCARLPYEPIVEYVVKGIGGNATITCTLDTIHLEDLLQDSEDLIHIKPYLRPMSSMTEEEREDFWKNVLDIDWRELDFDEEPDEVPFPFTENYCGFYLDNFYLAHSFAVIDWLNKKMFDYRGLIPAGAAIAINEKNNPYKD